MKIEKINCFGGIKMDAVIFDVDGTLWDSAEQVVCGWNNTFEEEGVDKRTTV